MSNKIYPRSPKEEMDGWIYLPRFIDKIRLHLAGKLDPDYQENFCKSGFDRLWLDAAGLEAEKFISVVAESITDGEVYDWVRVNLKKTAEEKNTFKQAVLIFGTETEALRERVRWRKEQAGFAGCDAIQTFVEVIDADEGRRSSHYKSTG